MPEPYDVLVIGTGITGLAAARHAVQSGLSTAMMEALFFGGLVTNINELDGEITGSGSDLAAGLMMEASKLGAKSITATASSIEREDDVFLVMSDAGSFRARTVIVASGARLRKLGIPGEAELEEKGVSHCADCDGPFYQNKDVVVVGGGDSALQEALVLAEFAATVHLVHRRAEFRAQPHLIDRLKEHSNIKAHLLTEVEAVLGTNEVEGVRVVDTNTRQPREIPCAGFFPYIGLEPVTDFVPPSIQRDDSGFLRTDAEMRTALDGVFAAGAVRSQYRGLLVHAHAEGVRAAKSAAESLR